MITGMQLNHVEVSWWGMGVWPWSTKGFYCQLILEGWFCEYLTRLWLVAPLYCHMCHSLPNFRLQMRWYPVGQNGHSLPMQWQIVDCGHILLGIGETRLNCESNCVSCQNTQIAARGQHSIHHMPPPMHDLLPFLGYENLCFTDCQQSLGWRRPCQN